MVSCEEVKENVSPASLRLAIDASVGGEHITEVEQYLEQILLWAHHVYGPAVLVQAKEDFYERTGKIFHDDAFFNDRISYFTDYFIFERKLSSHLHPEVGTPFEIYQKVPTSHSIQGFIHSIFSVQRVHDQYLTIRDLASTERHKIPRTNVSAFELINKKDLFQGFIYDLGSQKALSRGLIFHPTDAHSTIRKYIKSQQKKNLFQLEEALLRFAKQQLRHLRHNHVNPKLFYQQEPR